MTNSDGEIYTLTLTRDEVIADLDQAYREQNDVGEMCDTQLSLMWAVHGVHSGSWDWDDVVIEG